MDWVLRSPQIHSTFSNLGFAKNDGYHINESCNSALENILHNILSEDKYLLSYRRSISHGQTIQKDFIPLLLHTKDDKTVELIIEILANLTIPIEGLLNDELITDNGRHTVLNINNLLASTKDAFTDQKVSKALVDFLKKNLNVEPNMKLSEEQRTNVSNCLLLLRNILHIPDIKGDLTQTHNGSAHTIQNKILWNIFSQSIDKIFVKSMTSLDANVWGVTMVQLLALIYKDQSIETLSKLLNTWLEASLSESSEDIESNTSSPDKAGREDSSPVLTSEPTSDSSDNSNGSATSMPATSGIVAASKMFKRSGQDSTDNNKSATSRPDTNDDKSSGFGTSNEEQAKLYNDTTKPFLKRSDQGDQNKNQNQINTSDGGYGTRIENHESVSSSSNEDDVPAKKPKHQKPHNAKQRPNNKPHSGVKTMDHIRRKMVRREKTNIINVQGLTHKTPNDGDISNILKEFTLDFLLKGYNSLVQTLHSEILTNPLLEIDRSYLFWLLTYFLKFASQIQLDLEHLDSVLSFEIVSFLTSEGVNLCEQFELAVKLDGNDLISGIRKQHLVVTAIREFVQAIEGCNRNSRTTKDSREKLKKLRNKMSETGDLRSMFVLLLRHFNPKYHSKQYLKDIIETNHILLMFLDDGMNHWENNKSSFKMVDHLQQFATTGVMAQYGLLLNDYLVNGEYANDCIFTLMHHVVGELDSTSTLFQTNIVKPFTTIWKSDFEVCDDWTDLIEYVMNMLNKTSSSLINNQLIPERDSVEESKMFAGSIEMMPLQSGDVASNIYSINEIDTTEPTLERWTEDEISALNWNYMQSNGNADVIGYVTKQLKEDGIVKTSESVIRELFRQNLVTRDFYENQMKGLIDVDVKMKTVQQDKEERENDIVKFCEQLVLDGKTAGLDWVQEVLLEICHTKLQIHKRNLQKTTPFKSKLLSFEIFRIKQDEMPAVSPVAYHSLIKHESVPLIPWNCQQASIYQNLKFQQLLRKLGFHMPVDTGKFFIRIPHYWTVDYLLSIAGKVRPIDTTKLKFTVCELSGNSGGYKIKLDNTFIPSGIVDVAIIKTPENYSEIRQQNQATMVNYTPRPCSSFKPEVEAEQFTWLQFVQKSQKRKIKLNFESLTKSTEDMDIEMKLPVPLAAVPSFMGTTLPTAMPITDVNIKSFLDEPIDSAFETASVASDLTHMYVSDEEEKENFTIRPLKARSILIQ